MNFLRIEDQEQWNVFLLEKGGHLLQSYGWGEFKSLFGWRVERLALEDRGEIVAGAQLLLRPFLWGSLAYVPRGPVVEPQDRESLGCLLASLHDLAHRQGAIFLRLEPDWEDERGGRFLKEEGFLPAPQGVQPRSTIVVDLRRDIESILGGMKSKTRYNIRLAQRREVTVREGKEEEFDAFYRLLRATGKRDRFPVHSRGYYLEAWRTFKPQGGSKLLLAFYGDELLAGLLAFSFGERAYYLYGASSGEHRGRMPNYLLQWEAIRWAKGRGCLTYDLWGIPDEVGREGEPADFTGRREGLWGVYRFKRGFGGRVARTVGAFDYVYSPPLYWLLVKVAPRLRGTLYGWWWGR